MHGQNTVYPKSVKLAYAYTADSRLSSSLPRALLESLGMRLCGWHTSRSCYDRLCSVYS